MAGVKVTDLPPLATADAADIFYVVDSSANQSKQVDLTTIAAALDTLLAYVPLRGTAYTGIGQVTGDIEVDVAAGGLMTLRFSNGDIIGLGVDYGGYSAISFYDATANETVYFYLRGGDLYLKNQDTGASAGNLIGTINSLTLNKINSSTTNPEVQGHDGTYYAIYAPLLTNNQFYSTDGTGIGRTGYRRLPLYYAKYSALISQTGTNAPTEVAVIESDFNITGITATYAWTFIGTGHYHLTINGTIIANKWIVDPNKTIVRITNGQSANVSYSTELVSSGVNTLQISIKTANPQTGNLANGLMTRTLVEVEFYV
jgi:hypothetical protein